MLKFHYKLKNGKIPHYFKNITFQTHTQHTHNTRFNKTALSAIPKTTVGGNCLRYILPNILKDTPSCITDKVDTHSPQGFSNYIKQHFIKNYSEECEINNCYICRQTDT